MKYFVSLDVSINSSKHHTRGKTAEQQNFDQLSILRVCPLLKKLSPK